MEVADLSCSLCGKLYNRDTRCPRILSCGHTFCHLCLSQMFTHRVVRCPEDFTSLPLRKAAELPQNHIVLKLALKASGQFPPSHRCPDHHKPMEYFCLVDKVRICASCGLMGTHRGHEIRTEDDVSQEFDQRIQVLYDLVSVIQASQESCSEAVSDTILQNLFEKFLSRKATLETSLRGKFAFLRQQLADAEKRAASDLRKTCEHVESVFSQVRDVPQTLQKQLSGITDDVRSLIDQIDSGTDTISALELVSLEAERLLPMGEKALLELENQKLLPQVLQDYIDSLEIDTSAYTLENIGKAANSPKEEPQLVDLEEKHVRAASLSDMQLPAPAPLNEAEFSEILDKISGGTVAEADFSGVGGIGDRAVQIAPFLLANESLKKLKFANNQLTSLSLCSLFKAIEGNTTLEELDLWRNTIDSEVCEKLLGMLQANSSLTRVSVKDCWLGQSDAARLRTSDSRLRL